MDEEERRYAKFARLPKPHYPFPNLINPHIDELAREYNRWIDEDYKFHSEGARERHKRHRLTDIPARAFPTLTLEELRPVARYTSAGAILDDYLDHSSRAEVSRARERIMALLSGQDTEEPRDFGIFRQFYMLRQDAFACDMPSRLYEKFIAEINNVYVAYQDEKRYISANEPPPWEAFLVIRANSGGGTPFAKYVCMEKEFQALPDTVLEHPIILRLHALTGRMIGWHNDIISLPKELGRKGDVVNIVRVLEKEKQATLEDAYMMALEFHDKDLNEFLILRDNLPDFGAWQDLANRYVDALGVVIQGTYAWHIESGRYNPGAYVEPEHVSEEFQWRA